MRTVLRPSCAVVFTALLISSLGGCVSTTLVDQWKDQKFAGPPVHKLLVVGVQRDQGRRRVWEDAMVAALGRRGIEGESSYQVFPDKAPKPEDLNSMAARDHFDGVVATHFVRERQHIDSYPVGGWGPGWGMGGWGPGWGWGWEPWDSPGYIETTYRTDFQTDVYSVDADGGKLVWTGVTRSTDANSTGHVTDEISRVLVPKLVSDGILAGARK
jgi:hypothetical protein